jgi:hypothetical protein
MEDRDVVSREFKGAAGVPGAALFWVGVVRWGDGHGGIFPAGFRAGSWV